MAMAETSPRQKVGWATANTLVVVAAAIPVLWLVSLSFKHPSTLADGKFIPQEWT